ncbi:MAG: tetratricopeptide repeat protein [Terriglobales bacterium]
MIRVWLAVAALCLPLPLSAQAPESLVPPASTPDTTATAPVQLRRAEPPSESWTAAELEKRGDELRMEKAYADSIDYYRAALAKDGSAVLHNKIGIAELQMLRYDQAKREFDRAVKLNRNYAEAINNLGVIQYTRKNFKKAIRYYEKAIKANPSFASFYSNLGTAHFARKQYDKASAAYLKALEIDPEIFERRSSAGISAHLASPADRARYSYVVAKMYAMIGNSDRCLLYLRKAMEAGYAGISDVYKDEEFSQVRKDPRFTELMASKTVAVPN